MVKERDLHELRLGLPVGTTNEFVDFFGSFFAVGNGIDDQARTEGDISGSEDSRRQESGDPGRRAAVAVIQEGRS